MVFVWQPARWSLVLILLLILWGCRGAQTTESQEPEQTNHQPAQTENAGNGVAATFQPRQLAFSPSLVNRLRVPNGFSVNVFATDMGHARMLLVGPDGRVYVTRPRQGDVVALRDTDGDGVADQTQTVVSGLDGVHGIELHQNRLYLATPTRIYMAPMRDPDGEPGPLTVIGTLPPGGRHPHRTMAIGPDGKLYVSVGSSCNACVEEAQEYATILRMNPDGTGREVFAKGLRNTIGFGWHPQTRQMWGMDIGSDWLGGDIPPEDLNRLKAGNDYGWPFCYGNRLVDVEMARQVGDMDVNAYCRTTEPAVLTYQAHSSPIGMVFYTGKQFPAEYRGDAFAAMRGSWNRRPAVGYKVVRINFENGQPLTVSDFLTGFLTDNGQAQFARLAGVAVAPDGSLLVSDDQNGVIYRVSYRP